MNNDPRSEAIGLVDDGVVDARSMLVDCLNYMSWDDVQDMLESNGYVEEVDEEEEL